MYIFLDSCDNWRIAV